MSTSTRQRDFLTRKKAEGWLEQYGYVFRYRARGERHNSWWERDAKTWGQPTLANLREQPARRRPRWRVLLVHGKEVA